MIVILTTAAADGTWSIIIAGSMKFSPRFIFLGSVVKYSITIEGMDTNINHFIIQRVLVTNIYRVPDLKWLVGYKLLFI